MDEHLTDEQQAAIVKRWLSENGTVLLGGLVVALGGLFGWQQWQGFELDQDGRASEVYEEIVSEIGLSRTQEATTLLGELESDFAGSPYIDLSRLLLAKSHIDKSDFDTAATYLSLVAGDASSEEIRRIGQLRLARIRLHQQKYQDALAALSGVPADSAFSARFHEVRGDINVAMNQLDEARQNYDAALASSQQPAVIDRVFVQAKRDALGEKKIAAAPATEMPDIEQTQ